MDDTIEYLLDAWVKYLNHRYQLNVITEEIRDWDVTKAFPELSKLQIYEVLEERDLWKTVKPIPKADFILRKLKEEGHKVYIVTSSYYKTVETKLDLVLFKYFPFFSWKDVIIANDKHMIKGDVLVDDGPHNLINGDYKKILFTSPHNRDFEADGVTRVDNWDDVYEKIAEIANNSYNSCEERDDI